MRQKTGCTRKKPSCGIALGAEGPETPRLVIAGAGSIGCYVGGLLAAAGRDVTLLARPRVMGEIQEHGLTLSDLEGMKVKVTPQALIVTEDPACLAQADVVLVTVKSRDTQDIGALIARHAPANAQVVSLQNGVTNAAMLRSEIPEKDVRAGMVAFNVVPQGQGRYHRATDGDIVIEAGPGAMGAALSVPGLAASESDNVENIQWGKLLLNLNNALNALSGVPLREQLSDRNWRKLIADQMVEALGVIVSAGHSPVSSTPVSVRVIPWILRLPTFLFTRVAAAMLRIDPQARTSMAYDLMANRPTEIDALQGEIVRMGARLGMATPMNAAIAEVVREAEHAGNGSPSLTAADLRRVIAQSAGTQVYGS